eukprot:TRINITY_DN9244_c0_g1_i15.p1 TRINITY_DN9244_c0_g1~~TRINITY_DN9244_c0_g1_i15.p1  ORF type:complete len:561 (+),score=65.23 TRINITY_DN9244_c0_g1_i15:879-2561(+)
MFIRSTKRENEQSISGLPRSEEDPGPTLVFCNPNGGIYQFMSDHFIDSFLNLGINIFFWNYRGYGLSTGSPTPYKLRRDGEHLVKYVQSTLKVKKVGVYGRSMGGLVSTHVGATQNVDFMYADRTFSSLSSVVRVKFGSFLEVFFDIITWTLWKVDNTKNYLASPSYKVFSQATEEKVIPTKASLLYDLTGELLRTRYLSERGDPTTIDQLPIKHQSLTVKIAKKFSCLRGWAFRRTLQAEVDIYRKNFHHKILQDSAFEMLFESLRRICMSLDRDRSWKPRKTTFCPERHLSNKVDYQFLERVPFWVDDYEREELVSGDVSDVLASRISRSDSQTQSQLPLKSTNKNWEPYKLSKDLRDFLNDILDLIDSAGVRIKSVFSESPSVTLQKEHLQIFLVNLEMWGSYLPAHLATRKECQRSQYFQRLAIYKLKHVALKIGNYLVYAKSTRRSNPLPVSLLEDLEALQKHLTLVRMKLRTSLLRGTRRSNAENQTGSEAVMLQTHQVDEIKLELVGEKSQTTQREQSHRVGHLVPLHCGHNCPFDATEMHLIEHHLRAARFI